jgi:drug/metabolite transporter (DMT)-like permease
MPAPPLPVSTSRWPLVALILGACAIGFGPVLMRSTETGPAAAAFWRLAFALPFLAWPALKEGGMVSGCSMRPGLLAGVLFAIDLGAWHYAVAFTSVANATVLSNTTPVVVTVVAWLMFREKPARAFLFAMARAMAGAFVMAAAKGSGGHGTAPVFGDLLALTAALFYGGYFVVVRLARPFASTSQLMAWTSIAGAPVLLVAALLLREKILPSDWIGWAACGPGDHARRRPGRHRLGAGPAAGVADLGHGADPAGGGRAPRLSDLRRAGRADAGARSLDPSRGGGARATHAETSAGHAGNRELRP